MSTLLSPYHSSSDDFSPVSSPELDFRSLFEQCGIPLTDLGAQLDGIIPPLDQGLSGAQWYHGREPSTDEIVELAAEPEQDSLDGGAQIADSIKSGTSAVSPPRSADSQTRPLQEAVAKRSTSNGTDRIRPTPSVDRSKSSSGPNTPTREPSTPSKNIERTKDDMEFYPGLQQGYYSGPQLSSPTSMDSSPCDNDAFPYTPEISPQFSSWQTQEYLMNNTPLEAGAMQRSWSTPFLGRRSTLLSQSITDDAYTTDYHPIDSQVVPASNNGDWGSNGDYLLPQQKAHSVQGLKSPIGNVSRTMKRKHRPNPIATSMPYTSTPLGVKTAPIERHAVPRTHVERPPLSAKRSYEDFSELDAAMEIPAYRQITTPTMKKQRSVTNLNSPFTTDSAYSSSWEVPGSGLALAMDPEELLLCSPPYSQAEFCSSPTYALTTPRTISNFVVPQQLSEPLSPLDEQWKQKQVYKRPEHPLYAVPRTLTYGAPPKRTAKPRKSAVAKAISFCNFTAADKKTILSGVAPSGSNKKALKPHEMNRSHSTSGLMS